MKKQAGPDKTSYSNSQPLKVLRQYMPRTETLILLSGLACTIWGKFVVISYHKPQNLVAELTNVVFADVLFFAAVFLLICCLYMFRPSALSVRCALVISVLAAGWSVLNAAWLISSRVQLQPGILLVLLRDFRELWPLVKTYVAGRMTQLIVLSLVLLAGCGFFLWCFCQPRKVPSARSRHVRPGLIAIGLSALLFLTQLSIRADTELGFTSQALGFSSHWYALISTVSRLCIKQRSSIQTRNIPQINQCNVSAAESSPNELPNIVLVMMESISYSITSLGNAKLETTPYLARLADEGAQFSLTRIQVPQTTKAIWSTLTSTSPVIRADYAEAIPADTFYESLASVLSRVGYRCGFFQMAKGTFECAPAFFNNLAFDFAWFRENLEDPSAHLGYVGGDDCRMIKPAFEWILKKPSPFLLMMVTSVSHDPYLLPAGFAKPAETRYEKYLQTIRYTDYFLEELCNKLAEYNLDEDTLICILGDHGTSFRVQEGFGRWVPYEEVLHVPWVIHWPGHVEPGEKIDWPCSQLDVTPTILNLIGFDISQAGFEGKDAFEPSSPQRRLYFSSWYANSPRGYVEGDRKFIYWPYLEKVFEYDLNQDPNEQNPITVPLEQADQIRRDILRWQDKTQIQIEAKRYTEDFLFSHWQTFSAGRSAWAYYVP